MEIGVSGVNGALVARHASKESSQGNENATRQLLNTVARNAKEAQVNIKLATKMFLVQVFQFFFFVCQLHTMYNAETLQLIVLIRDNYRYYYKLGQLLLSYFNDPECLNQRPLVPAHPTELTKRRLLVFR